MELMLWLMMRVELHSSGDFEPLSDVVGCATVAAIFGFSGRLAASQG
jgi:hypothetical protein